MKDNLLIMKEVKKVKTENSSYKGNAIYTGASEGAKQVEVEF